MDFNIEVRKKQLQSLDQYISSSKDKVHSILDYLGWNSKNVIEKEPTTVCSMNASHYVPVKNNDVHLKKCYFNSSGYSHDDRFLSEPVNTTFSIKLDNTKKIEVLNRARENNPKFKTAWNGQDTDPMTSDRWFTTFSSDERLAMYDYCVKNTEQPPVPSEFNIAFLQLSIAIKTYTNPSLREVDTHYGQTENSCSFWGQIPFGDLALLKRGRTEGECETTKTGPIFIM
ncbi:hypothetical protein NQ315_003718 [Exocentrus adspersus]|uniref:Uncharacterized protein n=1 Tax=Exocentrus adspersus TaxID=1586481 RepID=A0AAV8V682_9CUCU|nr:hypothetical protein NQ315_003718 [Exocentrus adspersus]